MESGKTNKQLIVFAANANSIKNKTISLKFNIDVIKPHIVIIQETKLKRKSQIEIDGYRCFPTVRGDSGGGLLIACKKDLDPVWIFEGDHECEVLVVEVSLSDSTKIRVIAGYGAQECAPPAVREAYRSSIEEQISQAYLTGCMVLVAEDANAKLGPGIIPGDPHPMSANGKLLEGMIQRQGLKIINISNKCTGGPITRQRIVDGKLEQSCIDFLLASEDLETHIVNAIIDSDQLYTLTKYTTTKGNPSVKRSDHYSIIAKFGIEVAEKRKKREEIFKLRDREGLDKFLVKTTTSKKLIQASNYPDLEKACDRWYKEVNKVMHQCFK